jgi:hypothetical protein
MLFVQDDFPLNRRQAWGRLFGFCIEKTHEAGGRSVEKAARLAGALELGFEKIATLSMLRGDAWKQ